MGSTGAGGGQNAMQRVDELSGGVVSADQERAILALIEQPTVMKAAETSGVAPSTLYRWMKESAFQQAYREARRESFRQAIAMTQRYAPAAVQTLMKVMQDPTANHTAKVSAAATLLKFSRDSIELDDLAARIEALEQQAAARDAPPGPHAWVRASVETR